MNGRSKAEQLVLNLDENAPPRLNIDTAYMLMEMTSSVWTARKLDKKVTDETNTAKKAAKGASRVNKHLLAGRVELERITNFVAESRKRFYLLTKPWNDSGLRLLPAANFAKVHDEFEDRKDMFMTMVSDFVQVYPSIITAQAMVLGDMFSREDFPDAQDIATKFAFNVSFSPLPNVDDFRIKIGDQAAAELKQHYEKLFRDRIENVMRDNWQEFHDSIKHLIDRLGYDEVGEDVKPKVFRDSLVTNILEMCSRLKGFNLTDDPVMEDARRKLENLLLGVTPDELRKESGVRDSVRDAAQEIVDKFSL